MSRRAGSTASDRSKSKSLYQPDEGSFLRQHVFDLSKAELTFAAVKIPAKTMAKNLLMYYRFQRSRLG